MSLASLVLRLLWSRDIERRQYFQLQNLRHKLEDKESTCEQMVYPFLFQLHQILQDNSHSKFQGFLVMTSKRFKVVHLQTSCHDMFNIFSDIWNISSGENIFFNKWVHSGTTVLTSNSMNQGTTIWFEIIRHFWKYISKFSLPTCSNIPTEVM